MLQLGAICTARTGCCEVFSNMISDKTCQINDPVARRQIYVAGSQTAGNPGAPYSKNWVPEMEDCLGLLRFRGKALAESNGHRLKLLIGLFGSVCSFCKIMS